MQAAALDMPWSAAVEAVASTVAVAAASTAVAVVVASVAADTAVVVVDTGKIWNDLSGTAGDFAGRFLFCAK